jgi:hypothetical protein
MPFVRPSARARYPLCITFSVLTLAYSLDTVADVLSPAPLRRTPTSITAPPAPSPGEQPMPLALDTLSRQLGLKVVSPSPPPFPEKQTPALPSLCALATRQLGPHLHEVSRREGPPDRHCVAEPPRSGPFIKNGVAQGITLFSIHPNSFFFQLGLRDQDLLLRLNGIPLNSPEGMLEAYALVLKASRVELELERGGRLLRQTYLIKI